MEDTEWWVWLVIAVAAVLIIGALVAAFGPAKRAERKRSEAAELRERALAAQEEVRVRETEAAATRAKVEEAKVRAEELERRAQSEQQAADEIRDDARDRLAKADRIDPDVHDDRTVIGRDHHEPGVDADHERLADDRTSTTRDDPPRTGPHI